MDAPPPCRQTLSLDPAWRFQLGDIPTPLPNKHIAAYMANKAGYARGGGKANFDDTDWRLVDLPHDWSVEGEFNLENHINAGYLPRGVAWYRRKFALTDADRTHALTLQFDGLASHAIVYVNGQLLHRHHCGYTPFAIDITDVAEFGQTLNTIAVRVDATAPEGWWYEGAGIYRHVWLIKTSRVHIRPFGIFVRPNKVSADVWQTYVRVTIVNRTDTAADGYLSNEIFDDTGRVAARGRARFVTVPARQMRTFTRVHAIQSPKLWDLKSPNLYTLKTRVEIIGGCDEVTTTFGYRTIRFDPEAGFFLNEKPLRLLGTCDHQDHAGVGVAVPDSLHAFRVQRLLDMGSNAIRCAHNPPSPEFLDACDRLGLLVMDENRNFGSSPEHLDQLRAMVMRDRNHSSVILWSLCNEEAIQGTAVAAAIADTQAHLVRQLDPSRPVTAAVSGGFFNDANIADAVDVVGINYQLHLYDQFRAKRPGKVVLASETHCALQTRGQYVTNAEQKIFSSYDADKAPWGLTARDTWRVLRNPASAAGLFIWTGFDYRGEPSPHDWPSNVSHWGILDLCGFEKDTFHLHRAWFTKKPVLHLLPHWTWPEKIGQPIRVMVYTNCDSVELFLNGQSQGRKKIDPVDMADWQVIYQPGELKAVGYSTHSDAPIITDIKKTTAAPVALGLEIHPSFHASDAKADASFTWPITVFATDAAGLRVPTADTLINFSLTGPAKLIGLGNGDPNSLEPNIANHRRLFAGLAQVLVQTTRDPGEITLTASADGLRPATLKLQSTPAAAPFVPPAAARHFVTDWRMSPITPDRPDANVAVSESDMNTWERIEPLATGQSAWQSATGWAICRATFTPPKILQQTGGRIVFHSLRGAKQFFLNQNPVAAENATEIYFPPAPGPHTLSILFHAAVAPAGLAAPVELLPSDTNSAK